MYAFAGRPRRRSGEINRLVRGSASDHGLHATDIQALAAITDAEEPMTPSGLRRHLGLAPGAVTACVDPVTTGTVITSAGVVLAAAFAALGVIPSAFLARIGARGSWPTPVGETTKA